MTSKRLCIAATYLLKFLLRSSRLRRSFFPRVQGRDIFVHSRMDISNLKILLNIGDYIQYWIFMEGGYEQELCRFVSRHIRNRTFIDIGANIGSYSLSLCRHADQVYAFEASRPSCELLRGNAARNGIRNVTVVQRAVYDKDGLKMQLRLSNDTAGNNSLFFNEGGLVEEVETVTLDAYVREKGIQAIGVIKVDVEGSELCAIRGAAETIKSQRPILLCELNSGACRLAGYDVTELYRLIVSFDYNGFYINKGKWLRFDEKRLTEREFYENVIFKPAALSDQGGETQ
jgi:FkbM family methyltransferase